MKKIMQVLTVLLLLVLYSGNVFAESINELKTVRGDNLTVNGGTILESVSAQEREESGVMPLSDTTFYNYNPQNNTATYLGTWPWLIQTKNTCVFYIVEKEGKLTLSIGGQKQEGIETTKDNPLTIDLNGEWLYGEYTGNGNYADMIYIGDLGNNYVKIENGGICTTGTTKFDSGGDNIVLTGINCSGKKDANTIGGLTIDNVDLIMGTTITGEEASKVQQTAVVASNTNLTIQGDPSDGVDGDNDTTINRISVEFEGSPEISGNEATGGVAFFNTNSNVIPKCEITDTTMLNVNRGLGTNGSEDQQAMNITLGSNAFIKTGNGYTGIGGAGALYLPNKNATTTIDGAQMQGSNGICVRGGTLNINSGTVQGIGNFESGTDDPNSPAGSIITGAGIVVATPDGYQNQEKGYGKAEVHITGGDINSQNGYSVQGTVGKNAKSTVWGSGSPLSITGGTFKAPNVEPFPINISNQAGDTGEQLEKNPAPTSNFITLSGTNSVKFNAVSTPSSFAQNTYFADTVDYAVLTKARTESQSVTYYSSESAAKQNSAGGSVYSVANGLVGADPITTTNVVAINLIPNEEIPTFYNNEQSQSIGFYLDLYSNLGILNNSSANLSWSLVNSSGSSVSQSGITVNQSSGTLSYLGSDLVDGVYTLKVSATNSSGSTVSDEFRFVVASDGSNESVNV